MDDPGSTAASARPPISYPPNAVQLVRTNMQMTMRLSQMADHKASMLMAATFVVFTISVGQARDGTITVPLAILATFALLSALLAISAVMPRVGQTPPIVYRDGKDHSNLLFFGRFAQMEEDDFITAVKARLHSEEDIYEVMIRDTYQNGVVLARRKYRYLGYAYRTFMIGLLLTFAAFVYDLAVGWPV